MRTTVSTVPDVKTRRRALGLRVVDLAVMADVSPTHLERIEVGYRPKRGEALPRIVAALDRAEREREAS